MKREKNLKKKVMRKNKFLLAFLLAATTTACSENKPFTGYVVAKEYVEGHMCHSEYKHTVKAYVPVHVPHVPPPHHHHYENAQFILHVANRYEVRPFHVDTFKFTRVQMLDKITLKQK